jgi:hypothetical protein
MFVMVFYVVKYKNKLRWFYVNINLWGAAKYGEDLNKYSIEKDIPDGGKEITFPWNVRVFTLPTCAIFGAIDGVFLNISHAAVYGAAGVLTFDASLLTRAGAYALSVIVDSVTLSLLGTSSLFMDYSNIEKFSKDIISDSSHLIAKPPISFNILTSRIVCLIGIVSGIPWFFVHAILDFAKNVIHNIGEIIAKATELSINFMQVGIACLLSPISILFFPSGFNYECFFSEKRNELG